MEKGWIRKRAFCYEDVLAKLATVKNPTQHQKAVLAMMLKGKDNWLKYKARKANNEANRRKRKEA